MLQYFEVEPLTFVGIDMIIKYYINSSVNDQITEQWIFT